MSYLETRAAVLSRSGDDETVGLEDVDALQTELETLLGSVVKRQFTIESEMDTLVNWQDKPRDKKDKAISSKVVS